MPIIGTKIRDMKNNPKIGIAIFFNKEVSTAEIINIIKSANIVKAKCLEK